MCQKLLIIMGTFWIPILVILAPKKLKTTFQGSNFGPTDKKYAIQSFQPILSLQKSMGGIAIYIWEKSNFWGQFDYKEVPKMQFFYRAGF